MATVKVTEGAPTEPHAGAVDNFPVSGRPGSADHPPLGHGQARSRTHHKDLGLLLPRSEGLIQAATEGSWRAKARRSVVVDVYKTGSAAHPPNERERGDRQPRQRV